MAGSLRAGIIIKVAGDGFSRLINQNILNEY